MSIFTIERNPGLNVGLFIGLASSLKIDIEKEDFKREINVKIKIPLEELLTILSPIAHVLYGKPPEIGSLERYSVEDVKKLLMESKKEMTIPSESKDMEYVTSGELWVSRTYKERGNTKKEETVEDKIQVKPFVHPHLARVKREGRVTINVGNFESVQVAVGVELPCYVEELAEAHSFAQLFVDERLNQEALEIKEARDAIKDDSKK